MIDIGPETNKKRRGRPPKNQASFCPNAKGKAKSRKAKTAAKVGFITLPFEPEDELLIARPVLDLDQKGGIEAIAGYIARRLAKTHPHLGDKNRKFQVTLDDQRPWMLELATSGFISPQDYLVKKLRVAEQVFLEIHQKSFYKGPKGDIQTLMEAFGEREELQGVDDSILRLFADRRIDIRHCYITARFRRYKLLSDLRNRRKITEHMI